MKMNSFIGKKILSIIRDGNYAHPGEEEAIELTFRNISKSIERKFDLQYLFNSFYAFDNQLTALESLRKVGKSSSTLIIFDYIDLGDYFKEPIIQEEALFLPHSIKSGHFENMLEKAGWSMSKITDISLEYERWYSQFIDKVHLKHKEIIEIGGEDALETVCRLYGGLLESIQKGMLGGVIVEAKPKSLVAESFNTQAVYLANN